MQADAPSENYVGPCLQGGRATVTKPLNWPRRQRSTLSFPSHWRTSPLRAGRREYPSPANGQSIPTHDKMTTTAIEVTDDPSSCVGIMLRATSQSTVSWVIANGQRSMVGAMPYNAMTIAPNMVPRSRGADSWMKSPLWQTLASALAVEAVDSGRGPARRCVGGVSRLAACNPTSAANLASP